mmetsp:Transcript_12752/g.14635  ORF Transcript_12752/g.14635 Transcript_12752/m.14635 type:complete len:342 (+) Transcript_12752:40-1065(+)
MNNSYWIKNEKFSRFESRRPEDYMDKDVFVSLFWEIHGIQRKCPYCFGSNVSIKEWPEYGRRVVDFGRTYYIVSARYKCTDCLVELARLKNDKAKELRSAGLSAFKIKEFLKKDTNFPIRATFMGWSDKHLATLNESLSAVFPAVLTSKSGLDKMVVRLNREQALKGTSWAAMAQQLNTLQQSNFHRRHFQYASALKSKRFYPLSIQPERFYKSLKDFGGHLVSGFYIKSVYNKNMLRLKPYHQNRLALLIEAKVLKADDHFKIRKMIRIKDRYAHGCSFTILNGENFLLASANLPSKALVYKRPVVERLKRINSHQLKKIYLDNPRAESKWWATCANQNF